MKYICVRFLMEEILYKFRKEYPGMHRYRFSCEGREKLDSIGPV
jgi:hypothetical protein